jgi:nucleoside-diphosphate-sugar epimerase
VSSGGRALITGGLGFVGYHLSVRLLAEGFEVHALDDHRRGTVDAAVNALMADRRYRLVAGDAADPECLRGLGTGFTHIFHLAAIVGVQNVLAQPYRVVRDNVRSLMNVLEWGSRQKDLRRIVFPSTSEVYAGTLESFGMPVPTPEDTPLAIPDPGRPRAAYMLSKIYGEALCRHSGLPFTILRPHNVYGPRMGMAHVIPELLQRAHYAPQGGALLIFSPDHTRTFCYIDDAVEIMLRLALSPAGVDGTFNLGAAAGETAIAVLAGIVAKVVGKTLVIEPGPVTDGSPGRRRPNVSRATSATGYEARIQLEEGVRRTYDWYRAHVFQEQAQPDDEGSTGASAARSSRVPV